MLHVAAVILRRDEKVLICRRGPGGSCGNLWEFPGGKWSPGKPGGLRPAGMPGGAGR